MVYDTRIDRSTYLEKLQTNITVVDTLKDIAKKCKYVITMLPDDDAVMAVYTDDNGILK